MNPLTFPLRAGLAMGWTGSLATVAITTVSLGSWAGDHVMPRVWARGVLDLLGIRVDAVGNESLEAGRTYVFVSNHESILDGLALVVSLRQMPRFVGKDAIGKIPVFGAAWKKLGHLLIDREKPQQAYEILEAAADSIASRYSIYIAPEGRRKDDIVETFKRGAFVYAKRANVPVVPVAIRGAGKLWKPGQFSVTPGTLRIRFGEPFLVEDIDAAAAQAEAWIRQARRDLP